MSVDLDQLDDSALVALAQKGHEAAFGQLYNRHASGVARALASFAGPDRDLLDDLTQDVFFRVIKGLSSYKASHPFTHWLYTITLNVGRNRIRHENSVVHIGPGDLEAVTADTEWSDDLTEEVLVDTLTRLVSKLPVKLREVVSLRTGAEMSYGEIAETLGIPEGTARSRMHNAVTRLRLLAAAGEEDRREENER